jgi:protein O-GlcNAc transferase
MHPDTESDRIPALSALRLNTPRFERMSRKQKTTAAPIAPPPQALQYYDRGVMLHEQGKLSEAEAAYRNALALHRHFAEARTNLGNVLKDQEKWQPAINEYRAALKIYPNHPIILNNLGDTLRHVGKTDQAIKTLKQVIQIAPDFPEPYNNLGIALCEIEHYAEAIKAFERVIEYDPGNLDAYMNLGNALRKLRRPKEALEAYEHALDLNPKLAIIYTTIAGLLFEVKKDDETIPYYQRALALEPDDIATASSLYHRLQSICDWSPLEALRNNIDGLFAKLKNDKEAELGSPFQALSRTDDPEENYIIAKRWSEHLIKKLNTQKKIVTSRKNKQPKDILKIGYLSCDFHHHATAHLMMGVFREHNREKFKIHSYSYGPDDGSDYRKQIIQFSDKFVDISELSDIEAARKIAADQIDILIDLKGYTKDNRLEICALQPAAVQVTYLGFPGTSGARFFDYVLTDRIVTPPEHTPYYTEKFAYLPDTYQCTDNRQTISSKVLTRADCGLPEDSFVFCSFNQPYKLGAMYWNIWMRALEAKKDSVLWLLSKSDTVIKNLRREAQQRGIDAERLVFAKEYLSKNEHLARIGLADLALDTRLYNGHTTTTDTLWAGVPVVAMQGRHFASRVSSSLLHAIGLPELVTYNLADYEALINRLASHPDELNAIREKLQRNRATQSLFDTEQFTRHLEQAYQMMWERYAQGEKPDHFEVVKVK